MGKREHFAIRSFYCGNEQYSEEAAIVKIYPIINNYLHRETTMLYLCIHYWCLFCIMLLVTHEPQVIPTTRYILAFGPLYSILGFHAYYLLEMKLTR